MSKLPLTIRQIEILQLMADEALTVKEVAHRLGLSAKTVDVHVRRCMERMKARTRAHAILLWDRQRRENQVAAAREQGGLERHGVDLCSTCGGIGLVRKTA